MPNEIEVASRALQKALDQCCAADDERFQLALKNLLDLLERDPFLAAAATEVASATLKRLTPIMTEQEAVVHGLIECRGRFVPPSERVGASDWLPPGFSLSDFDNLVAKDVRAIPPDLSGAKYKDSSAARRMAFILLGALDGISDQHRDKHWKSLRREVRALSDRVEMNFRERLNVLRFDAGVTLHRLRSRIAALNPTMGRHMDEFTEAERQELFEEAINEALFTLGDPKFEKVLYGQGSHIHGEEPTAEELKVFRAWRDEFQKELHLLTGALEYHLGRRSSRLDALRRYGRRSEWHRRDSLVDGIARLRADHRGGRKREDYLVTDAATYLFDQGFEGPDRGTNRCRETRRPYG